MKRVASFASSDGDSDSDASSYPTNLDALSSGGASGHGGGGGAAARDGGPSLLGNPLQTLGRPLRRIRQQTLHGQSFFNLPVGASLGDGDAALSTVTEEERRRVRLWNFFRGHLAYFVCCILAGGGVASRLNGLRFIDGLYLACGAMTGASLAPVEVRTGPSRHLTSHALHLTAPTCMLFVCALCSREGAPGSRRLLWMSAAPPTAFS